MAARTVAEIHADIAATLAGVAGWRESRWPYDLLGMDPDSAVHKTFAVGFGPTTPLGEMRRGGRQQPAAGVQVETAFYVRILWRLRPDALRADYLAATDGEHDLVKALSGDWPASTHLFFRAVSERQALETGWYVGTTAWDVHHGYALS